MTEGFALALALLVLAATLGVAVARPPYLSEALAASVGAVLLVVVGAIGLTAAGDALRDLGPTVGFLAALLVIADGCRREGLFDAMGAVMARGSGGSPQRLLAFVFVIAAAITAVLSLDATIVLLTPVVFATAARMRTSTKPQVYACAHLANSASLLLPVSNLTNLLAFHASHLSFLRFGALMVLPTIAAVAVEWVVFTRFFAVPQPLREISEQAANELLAEAQTRLGRPAALQARRGRVEREVVSAAEGMDVLVLARDGDRERLGPRSLGPATRFVIDHAPCRVLLIWPGAAPELTTIPPPPRGALPHHS